MVLAPFDLDDDLFSDVRVVFSIDRATCEDSGHVLVAMQDANQEDLSFLAHKVIVAHSSSVLKTMLLRAAEEQHGEAQQPASSPMELEIPIEEDEQLAAEVLIRHMYTGEFSQEVDKVSAKTPNRTQDGTSRTLLLVLVYRLADRLEVRECLQACATAISKLQGKDLGSADDVNYICSLMSSAPLLCDKPPIDGLLIKCGKALLIKYPSATALCKSPPKELEPFLRLTFHAMLALLSSDLLQAESENDVLVLACHWVRHNTPSQSQLLLLSQRIRLKHLTPSFLASLNVIAPWVPVTPQMLCKLLSLQNCTLALQQAGWKGPPAWFGPQRASELSSAKWTAALDKEHVSKIFEAARGQGLGGWASDAMDIAIPAMRVYYKGYYFQAAIDVEYHKRQETALAPAPFSEPAQPAPAPVLAQMYAPHCPYRQQAEPDLARMYAPDYRYLGQAEPAYAPGYARGQHPAQQLNLLPPPRPELMPTSTPAQQINLCPPGLNLPLFDIVFALRVSHALEVSGAAKGEKESGDEGGSTEEAARKEVVVDQASWDCDIFSIPVYVEAVVSTSRTPTTWSDLVQAKKSSLLSMDQKWIRVGTIAHDMADANSFMKPYMAFGVQRTEPQHVHWKISGLC
eukprot:gene2139-18188_t